MGWYEVIFDGQTFIVYMGETGRYYSPEGLSEDDFFSAMLDGNGYKLVRA